MTEENKVTNDEPAKDLNDHAVESKDRNEVRKMINTVQTKMEELGRENGSYGINLNDQQVKDRASIETQNLLRNAVPIIAYEKELLEDSRAQKDYEYQDAYDQHALEKSNFKQLTHGRYHVPLSCSRLAFIFYGFLGFFLLLSDIPLALQLIQKGFKFDDPAPENAMHKLFSVAFRNVITDNWEVILTAIGISFCTVMIKIVYDEMIGTPYAAEVLRRKQFFDLFHRKKKDDNTDYFTPTEANNIRYNQWLKTLVKLVLLAGTIYMIFTLGQFRVKSLEIVDIERRYNDDIEKAVNRNTFDSASSGSHIRELDDRKQAAIKQNRIDNAGLYSHTFSVITLFFPIISGICLSLSLTALQNRRKIKKSEKLCEQLESVLQRKADALGKDEAAFKEWLKEEEYISHPDWLKSFSEKLVSLYQYGYTTGKIRPDFKKELPDILTIIQSWRNKIIYYRTNQKLGELHK